MSSIQRQDSTNQTIHRISSEQHQSGYAVTVFEGKQEQMVKVCAHIQDKGFVPRELVDNEVNWFYGNLGIDDSTIINTSIR